MITAATLEDLYDRMDEARARWIINGLSAYSEYLTAHAAYQRALIVQARADATMRGEP